MITRFAVSALGGGKLIPKPYSVVGCCEHGRTHVLAEYKRLASAVRLRNRYRDAGQTFTCTCERAAV